MNLWRISNDATVIADWIEANLAKTTYVLLYDGRAICIDFASPDDHLLYLMRWQGVETT